MMTIMAMKKTTMNLFNMFDDSHVFISDYVDYGAAVRR